MPRLRNFISLSALLVIGFPSPTVTASCPSQPKGALPSARGEGGEGTCTFPFTYSGTTYTSCAKVSDYGGVGWCAWDADYTKDRWGYCTKECPGYPCKCRSNSECSRGTHTTNWCYIDSMEDCSDSIQGTGGAWSELVCKDVLSDNNQGESTDSYYITCDEPTTVPLITCVPKGETASCVLGERSINGKCQACEANTFADGTRLDGANDGGLRVSCKLCPSNSLTRAPKLNGATSKHDCVARCLPGQRSQDGSCTPCNANSFSDGFDSDGIPDNNYRTECRACKDGEISEQGSSVCLNDTASVTVFGVRKL